MAGEPLAAGQQAALAGGGPGGGSPYGGVSCGQSYAPSCAVTAGSGPSAGTPASGGTGAGGLLLAALTRELGGDAEANGALGLEQPDRGERELGVPPGPLYLGL
jgi:hypothetical protein